MPIYQYHCQSCGRDLEIFQHMTDPTLTVCPECQGQLRKVFSPVGIVFKGSGFYATDNKKSSSASASVPAASTATTTSSETGATSTSADASTSTPKTTESSSATATASSTPATPAPTTN